MPFAAATSRHPVAAEALGEALGQVLEQGGTGPDLAVVATSAPHDEFASSVRTAVERLLRPVVTVVVDPPAGAVLPELPAPASVSVLAGWIGDVEAVTGRVDDLIGRIGSSAPPDGAVVLTGAAAGTAQAADLLGAERPDLAVVGGGWPRRGDDVTALLLSDAQVVGPTFCTRGRVVGDRLRVDECTGSYVLRLDGSRARLALDALLATLGPVAQGEAVTGLHLLVHGSDVAGPTPGPGDRLVRILGVDRRHGVLGLDGPAPPVGSTVSFWLVDAAVAEQELRDRLHGLGGSGVIGAMGSVAGRDATASVVDEELDLPGLLLGTTLQIGPVRGATVASPAATALLVLAG